MNGISVAQEVTRVCGALCQQVGVDTKYMVLIMSQLADEVLIS